MLLILEPLCKRFDQLQNKHFLLYMIKLISIDLLEVQNASPQKCRGNSCPKSKQLIHLLRPKYFCAFQFTLVVSPLPTLLYKNTNCNYNEEDHARDSEGVECGIQSGGGGGTKFTFHKNPVIKRKKSDCSTCVWVFNPFPLQYKLSPPPQKKCPHIELQS